MKQIPNQLFFEWVEQEIAEGRSVRFRLVGHSMFPLIRNGKDEVLLTPCTEEDLRPMDVVLFRYQGKHVLHRILCREGSQLILQGDGFLVTKELCNTADVVGKVSQIPFGNGRFCSSLELATLKFLVGKARSVTSSDYPNLSSFLHLMEL